MASLEKWWVTGFVDGEGCFSVSFTRRERRPMKLEVRPSFSLAQSHGRGMHSLKALQVFFGCGHVRPVRRDGTYTYEVRRLQDLWTRVIPHFQAYPLVIPKGEDFARFVRICALMRRNLHHSPEGLLEIIDLAMKMNPSGKRRYDREALLTMLPRHVSRASPKVDGKLKV